ncbi:uncharacterized protein LOC120003758 isoform X2 [Tripterygium wilfordii]|uniref:uncharacterized protein LOC120003758 isoform X2 n=1 Tax=Tripterygium wilfordii TaxID=458696 RepID=UPI0018F82829|nr:uncharacterized protein LOC120003758 isoform X2 [Tripterygium wilfordii]
MAKRDTSSDSDPETPENSCSEEEEETENGKGISSNAQAKHGISDYEKQRLERIAANRAKLQALGLPKIASSLMGSSASKMEKASKRKGKSKVAEDDEDYKPNYDDVEDGAEDDDNGDDECDEFQGSKSRSNSRGKKVKNKGPKYLQKFKALNNLSDKAYDDDDDDLMKAIALSLQDSGSASGAMHDSGPAWSSDARVIDATPNKRKGNACKEEDTGKRRRKKLFSSRVKMTEDELVIHFFQFDEVGTGSLGIRDLRRVAAAHDFTWTDDELAVMINCFDGDGDGKLNLDDFRKIASRCKMIEGSEDS